MEGGTERPPSLCRVTGTPRPLRFPHPVGACSQTPGLHRRTRLQPPVCTLPACAPGAPRGQPLCVPPSTRPAHEREGGTGRVAKRVSLYEALPICRPGSPLPSITQAALDNTCPLPPPLTHKLLQASEPTTLPLCNHHWLPPAHRGKLRPPPVTLPPRHHLLLSVASHGVVCSLSPEDVLYFSASVIFLTFTLGRVLPH